MSLDAAILPPLLSLESLFPSLMSMEICIANATCVVAAAVRAKAKTVADEASHFGVGIPNLFPLGILI